jgi:hypothetical protein
MKAGKTAKQSCGGKVNPQKSQKRNMEEKYQSQAELKAIPMEQCDEDVV